MSGRRTCDRADRSAADAARGNGLRIATFVGIGDHLAFTLVELFAGTGIHGAEPRAEFARHAVRKRNRIEPNVELALAFDFAGALHFGHGTSDVAAGRDLDVIAVDDREGRFEINAVPRRGTLGA